MRKAQIVSQIANIYQFLKWVKEATQEFNKKAGWFTPWPCFCIQYYTTPETWGGIRICSKHLSEFNIDEDIYSNIKRMTENELRSMSVNNLRDYLYDRQCLHFKSGESLTSLLARGKEFFDEANGK
jgi:hypothetical protein